MPKTTPPSADALPKAFEPEYIQQLKLIFEESIVFNQILGLKVHKVQADICTASIAMRPELIGHYSHNRMHGGVISASLDAMGGLAHGRIRRRTPVSI